MSDKLGPRATWPHQYQHKPPLGPNADVSTATSGLLDLPDLILFIFDKLEPHDSI